MLERCCVGALNIPSHLWLKAIIQDDLWIDHELSVCYGRPRRCPAQQVQLPQYTNE